MLGIRDPRIEARSQPPANAGSRRDVACSVPGESMPQTIVEKIAQAHMSEGPKRPLRTGDFISIYPHHVMTHDNTSAVMSKFRGIGAKKVNNPKQLVFALDH